MAREANLISITRVAAADLSGKQYCFVKLDANGKVVACAAGEPGLGILQNKPAAGQAATVAVWGISKLKTSSVIAPGAFIASDANGEGVTATAAAVKTDDAGVALDDALGSFVIAQSLAEANTADNDVFSVLIIKAGLV